MGGGGGGGTNTTTVRSVPDWAIPYVTAYGQTANDLWLADTLSAYTGEIIADQPDNEVAGIAGLAARGRYGDEVISKAITYERDAINGGYLPGTKANFLAVLALVTGNSATDFVNVNSRIGRKPYFINDPDSTYLAQSLVTGVPALYNARMSALLYNDNYQRERKMQDYALAYGVEMGKHAAIDAEALRRAGLYVREYTQGTYELAHKLFIESQEMAVANLEIFGNAIRALTGSQQTSTRTGMEENKMMSVVGGAITGAIIGSIIPGVGTLVGGIVGGIIGWFA